MNFPKIVGILNVTPDSFSDGGNYLNHNSALDYALKMLDNGADIIDIGGESTRPGSDFVEEDIELQRVLPVIKSIKSVRPNAKVSLDSTKFNVIKSALDCGIDFINDVSCLRYDEKIASLANEYKVPLILMHSRENPKNMQHSPHYNNLWGELIKEIEKAVQISKNYGVQEIIIDPGIGFAKSYEHNIEILRNFQNLYTFNLPIMLAISRKSFIGKMLDISVPEERDMASILIHSLMLHHRIDYIRIHNVSLANQLLKIYNMLN